MEDLETSASGPARPRRGRMAASLGGAALLAVAMIAGWWRVEIGRALEPAPASFDPKQAAPFSAWMREALPAYVIAVSRRDPERIGAAAVALEAAGAFNPTLLRRGAGFTAAVAQLLEYAGNDLLLQRTDRLQSLLDDVQRELEWLEEDLRRMRAPYCIDYDVVLFREGTSWAPRLIVRTSEILATSRFRAGTEELLVRRVARVDGLSLLDLTHGTTRNGIAQVHVAELREVVINRLLPALAARGELRDLLAPGGGGVDFVAETFRATTLALLPEQVRPAAVRVGELAHARRRALEAVDALVAENGVRLVPPAGFFLSAAAWTELRDTVVEMGAPELVQRLRRFSPDTDLTADAREEITRVSEHFVELLARNVERHEAWHLLVPAPRRAAVLPVDPNADHEVVAYLGMLADAEDEALTLVDDLIVRLASELEDPGVPPTPTALALRLLRTDDTGAPPLAGLEAASPAARVARQRRHLEARRQWARARLHEWFGESRSIRWVDTVSGLGPP
jgi:hypothetical protein